MLVLLRDVCRRLAAGPAFKGDLHTFPPYSPTRLFKRSQGGAAFEVTAERKVRERGGGDLQGGGGTAVTSGRGMTSSHCLSHPPKDGGMTVVLKSTSELLAHVPSRFFVALFIPSPPHHHSVKLSEKWKSPWFSEAEKKKNGETQRTLLLRVYPSRTLLITVLRAHS